VNVARPFTIGTPFNPRYNACGFYPAEIVARRRDLSDGQKLIYTRLVGWARTHNGARSNERAGEVWRSHKNIASELGKSERQVRRDLKRLEEVELIKHRVRDGRKSNTYVFLFHPSFERASASAQMTPRTHLLPSECPPATGPSRPVKSDSNGQLRPPNQEMFNQRKYEPSSSSSQENGRLNESEDCGPEKTQKDVPINPPHQPSQGKEMWWTQEELEEAMEILEDFARFDIDIPTVLAILPHVASLEDLRLWLHSSSGLLLNATTWGLFVSDARRWPARRAATKAYYG